MNQPPSEFAPLFDLPFEQRLQLAQDLWDSVADEVQSLPISDAQRAELQRRAAAYDAGEVRTLSWDEVERLAAST